MHTSLPLKPIKKNPASPKNILILFLKGSLMGIADLIPGVSGGTIALLVGIYSQLILSISHTYSLLLLLPKLLLLFLKKKIKKNSPILFNAQSHLSNINFPFLLPLALGILTTIFLLAKIVKFLLDQYSILLFATFSGFVSASILTLSINLFRKQPKTQSKLLFLSIIYASGAALGFLVIRFPVSPITPNSYYSELPIFFLVGSIAICAMILPGISGSFILLLLNKYDPVINAIKNLDIPILSVFAIGCLFGLGFFSHFLKWCLKKYYQLTLALMTGFMLGALPKLWPWKTPLQTRLLSSSPPNQQNISPLYYEKITSAPSYLWTAIALGSLAALIFFLFFRFQKNKL